MKTLTQFMVFEIEHDEDLEDALDGLFKAGAENIEVVRSDFDSENAAICALIPGDWFDFMEKAAKEGVCL